MLEFTFIDKKTQFRYWLSDQRPIVQKVLWFMDDNANWNDGSIFISNSVIAEHFNTTERNIRIAISILRDADVIRGGNKIYALNPDLIWSGYGKLRKNAIFSKLPKASDTSSEVRFNPNAKGAVTTTVSIEVMDEVINKTKRDLHRKSKKPVGETWGSETKPAIAGDKNA